MSSIGIRRKCPACGRPMQVLAGSQRTTRTCVYYEMICTNCLLRLDGCKPRRAHRKADT